MPTLPPHAPANCYPLGVHTPQTVAHQPSPTPITRVSLLIAIEAAVAAVWGGMTAEEHAAYHEFSCRQERTEENTKVANNFAARVRALVGATGRATVHAGEAQGGGAVSLK